jgi:hypothetical protein
MQQIHRKCVALFSSLNLNLQTPTTIISSPHFGHLLFGYLTIASSLFIVILLFVFKLNFYLLIVPKQMCRILCNFCFYMFWPLWGLSFSKIRHPILCKKQLLRVLKSNLQYLTCLSANKQWNSMAILYNSKKILPFSAEFGMAVEQRDIQICGTDLRAHLVACHQRC